MKLSGLTRGTISRGVCERRSIQYSPAAVVTKAAWGSELGSSIGATE
jgi:hypothetical protein